MVFLSTPYPLKGITKSRTIERYSTQLEKTGVGETVANTVTTMHYRTGALAIFGVCFLIASGGALGCDSAPHDEDGSEVTLGKPALPELPHNATQKMLSEIEWGGALVDITPKIHPSNITLTYSTALVNQEAPVPSRAVTTGLLVDLDMNGTQELIVSSESCCMNDEIALIHSYDETTGEWIPRPDLEGALSPDAQAIVGALDVDGDGLTDLIYSDPQTVLRWGTGDGTFSEKALDVTSITHETRGLIQVYDINRDGLLDLLVGAHDCTHLEGQSLTPILQEGRRRWRIAPEALPKELLTGVYYSALVYPSPLGETTLFLSGRPCSQMDPHESFLVRTEDNHGEVSWDAIDPTTPDSTYKEWPTISFGPISKGHPMGAAISDMNEDGILDFMTTLDFRHLIFEGLPNGLLDDKTPGSGFYARMTSIVDPLTFATGWGVGTVDMDGDGREDILVANGPLSEHSTRVDMGISMYWNGGDFSFADVAGNVGLPMDGEWRSLQIDDLDDDGDADILVGGIGNPPRLFRNDIQETSRTARVQLHGRMSDPHGVGAMISWEDDDTRRVRMMGHISSPSVQGIPSVFVTFPPNQSTLTLTIQWPSGLSTTETLTVGKNAVFAEPELVHIEPFSRWIHADGNATAKIRISPSSPDQQVRVFVQRDGKRVEVGLSPEGDELTYAWTSSTTPRSSQFEIELDGTPLNIRPIIYEIPVKND